MSEVVFLNGSFRDKAEALISPEDRGFNFADGVYEVVKFYGGIPFRMKDHIERLDRSLSEVRIDYIQTAFLPDMMAELLSRNGLSHSDAGVYLQITRGASRRVHHFPSDLQPTVYAYAFPFPSFSEALDKGIRVTTADDIRWLRCDIKSVALLPNTMLYQQAVENGAGECILVRDGRVTEATHSSVFVVKNGILYTHPASNLILPGITRKVVLELCIVNGIAFSEHAVKEPELYEADEIFIAGTGSEITPVVQVNDKLVCTGVPGRVTRWLQGLFFDNVRLVTGNGA